MRCPNAIEEMRDAGFHTSAVVASFPLTRRFGFGRGFDDYSETFSVAFREGSELNAERVRFERRIRLESTAPFVSVPQLVHLTHGRKTFAARVSAEQLPEGEVHYAEILGYDVDAPADGPPSPRPWSDRK